MSLLPATLLLAFATAATAPQPAPAPKPAATSAATTGQSSTSKAASSQHPASTPQDVPIPEKLPPPASDESAPTVTIRATDTGDRVEEYRQGGRIFMVKITPVRGKAYYLYDDDRNGRLDRSDSDNIAPVYWTIYEWD